MNKKIKKFHLIENRNENEIKIVCEDCLKNLDRSEWILDHFEFYMDEEIENECEFCDMKS